MVKKSESIAISKNAIYERENKLYSLAKSIFNEGKLKGVFSKENEKIDFLKTERSECCDFVKSRIVDFLLDSKDNNNSQKWKTADISMIITELRKLCKEKENINLYTVSMDSIFDCDVFGVNGIDFSRFLCNCLRTKKYEVSQVSPNFGLLDVKKSMVYNGILLKDAVLFNLNGRAWGEKTNYDLLVLSNFYELEREVMVPEMIMDNETFEEKVIEMPGKDYTYDMVQNNNMLREAVERINNAHFLFCYFDNPLNNSCKNEFKNFMKGNNIALKSYIHFFFYTLYEDRYEDVKESNLEIPVGDVFILQKGVKQDVYNIAKIKTRIDDTELIEIVKSLTESTDNKNVIRIPSNIDFAMPFSEIKQAKEDNDLLQNQFGNGFQLHNGINLIKRILYYKPDSDSGFLEDTNAFYLPIKPKIFHVTGISDTIDDLRMKVFTSDLKISDLILKHIPWYQHISRKYSIDNLSEKEFPLNGSWENLETGIPENEYYVPSDVMIKFIECYGDIGITEEIVNGRREVILESKNDVVQILRPNKNNSYNKYDLIKNQIVKTNCVQVLLDEKIVWWPFFEYYLNYSETGKKLMEHWREECLNNVGNSNPLDIFKTLKIILPDVKRQKELLQQLNYIKETERMAKLNTKNIKAYIDGKIKIFNVLTGNDGNFQMAHTNILANRAVYEALPQPLAAILYLDECEKLDCYCRKNKNLLNFIEAAAQFHATVLLSVLAKQEIAHEKVVSLVHDVLLTFAQGDGSQGKNPKPYSYINLKLPFGTWTKLIKECCGQYPGLLHTSVKQNEAFLNNLDKGRIKRNEESAHTYGKTVEDDRRLYEELQVLAGRIVSDLIELYRDVDVLYIKGKCDREDGTSIIYGGNAKGISNRLRYTEITIEKDQSISVIKENLFGLSVKIGNKGDIVPLIPLIYYEQYSRSDETMRSLYFAKEIEAVISSDNERKVNNFVHWQTYDFGDIRSKYEYYQPGNSAQQVIDWIIGNLN